MNNDSAKSIDYIIAGAGCAGLSLLYRILLAPNLRHKQILVIDKERKTKNDRTWCFWETTEGVFQPAVCHQWNELEFKSREFCSSFNIQPYTYKMITGADFYRHVHAFASNFSNVKFLHEHITSISATNTGATVKTNNGNYSAGYVFNSTRYFSPDTKAGKHSQLMHLKGWSIKTNKACFDISKGTLMDFTIDQQFGSAFMYLLPTSRNEALVEYTLINGKTLSPVEYDTALQNYITNHLKIDNFEIVQEESGVIPMTKKQFPIHHKRRIIHIGTAGGCVKASSGYAFQFIQEQTAVIVDLLRSGKTPVIKPKFNDKKFKAYDRTFLEVLISKKMPADKMMALLFQKNKPSNIMAFLANESRLSDEYFLMTTLPAHIFLPVALKELLII